MRASISAEKGGGGGMHMHWLSGLTREKRERLEEQPKRTSVFDLGINTTSSYLI
jgi:hypothetical protein